MSDAPKKDGAKEPAKKSAPAPAKRSASEPIVRTVTYLAPGEAPTVERDEPSLDPRLAEIREEEAKRNDEVKVEPRQEPTIDPELEKARDEQVKRETERARKSSN